MQGRLICTCAALAILQSGCVNDSGEHAVGRASVLHGRALGAALKGLMMRPFHRSWKWIMSAFIPDRSYCTRKGIFAEADFPSGVVK